MSAAVRSVPLRLISANQDGAVRRIHLLMRQRDALRPLFRSAWDNLAARFDADELEGWAAGVLALADVNAGPSCLVAFWEISRSHPTEDGIASLIVAAQTAANVCRHAGAQATAATLNSVAVARRILGAGPGLARWWRAMDNLAQHAPESVAAAAARMAAPLFAETALRAKSGPGIFDDHSAVGARDRDRIVLRARVDNNDLGAERTHRLQGAGEPIAFIQRAHQHAEIDRRRNIRRGQNGSLRNPA